MAEETQMALAPTQDEALAKDDGEDALQEGQVLCCKCNFPLDVLDFSSRKVGKHGPTCKSCHNICCMLQKQMSHMPEEWDLMSPEEHVDFFQRCNRLKDEKGLLKYVHVKAQLVDTLVTKELTKHKRSAVGEYQPLKYWTDRGYDSDIVKARAAKMEHPTLGVDVYRVDVFAISQEHIQEQIEEKIISCSRDVKKRHTPVDAAPKKRAKGKGKGKDADQGPPKPEPTQQEIEEKALLKSLVIDSDSDIEIVP